MQRMDDHKTRAYIAYLENALVSEYLKGLIGGGFDPATERNRFLAEFHSRFEDTYQRDGFIMGPKLDNEREAIEASQGEALGDDPGVVLREPLTLIARGDFEGCRDEVVSMLNENGIAAVSSINEQNRSVMFKVPGSKAERATLTLYASGKATTGGKQTSPARTALRDIADSLGFDVRS